MGGYWSDPAYDIDGKGLAGVSDVWVGPDGAAYVTDSSLPRIRRVSEFGGE